MDTASPSEPYRDIESYVHDELQCAWLRVELEIRRGWSKAQPGGGGEDAALTPEDLGRMFGLAHEVHAEGDAGAEIVLERWLARHRRIEARVDATLDAGIRLPILDLRRTFGLSSRQHAALMFSLLPEIDPNLVHAYRYLARDASCRGLDGRLLALLVYDTPRTRAQMARDLSPSSPLIRYRLVDVSAGSGPSDSLMFRRLRAATRLLYLLDDGPLELDPELAEFAELRAHPAQGEFPAATIDVATAALGSSEVVLVLQGQRGVGKKLALQLAAERRNKPLLVLDTRRLAQQSSQPAIVRALVRELILLDALPVFADADDAVSPEGDHDAMPVYFEMFIDEWSGPIAITINRERMPRIQQRPIVHASVEVPARRSRVAIWQQVVPMLADPDAEALAGRYAIPGGIILAAAQAADAGRLPGDAAPQVEALDRAVAAQLHQRISRLGKKLVTTADLDDLIVDDDTRAALLEIATAARERAQIRDRFELRGAQGISVLFSGHPGVGKTMSSTVLAKRLGLDIYEIDLSQVVSKWLGETEKNLSDLFDAAEPGHVVLLFNEADSLFGKRTTDVKNSNDRYANLETNYLLQRLERFNGLAILTTNLVSAIDQAFKRRFSYDVFFSFPSADMRAKLWRRTLPERARSARIDFDSLAEKYELSGGFIKVACERAAYLAGAAGREIDEPLLRATIERMYRERGKLSAVGPLE